MQKNVKRLVFQGKGRMFTFFEKFAGYFEKI
jgi:hypothetical protein